MSTRRSKKGNSVYARLGVWRGANDAFVMKLEGVKGTIAVTGDRAKNNGHPALFKMLTGLFNDKSIKAAQRPTKIQVQFVAQDGTITKGPVFKLPSTV